MHLDLPTQPPPHLHLEEGTNGPLLIQLVTLSKPLATSIFIETPDHWKVQISAVNKDRAQKKVVSAVIQDKQIFLSAR